MYRQQKRYNMAMDRFSEYSCHGLEIKAGKYWFGWAASSCNAFAIAMFSSYKNI